MRMAMRLGLPALEEAGESVFLEERAARTDSAKK